MTDGTVRGGGATGDDGAADLEATGYNFTGSAVVAVALGVLLAWPARSGAVELLVAVAVVQGLLAFAWVYGLRLPGRIGAIVLAGGAAAASDAAVSVWPHSRLGPLLAVLGLAVPVMFVHQLWRGAARVRVVESLGGIVLLVAAEVSLPALVQLRHEFVGHTGGDVVFAVAAAGAGALVVGYFADMVVSEPRFDADVPRGLLAVILSAAVGGAIGHLVLRDNSHFAGGRAVFAGAALGALVALFAVGVAFVEHAAPPADSGFGRRVRPVLGAIYPLCVLAPVAFLLCLAIRT